MIEFNGAKFYEINEVAKTCNVHRRTVHGWVLKKKMSAQKIGAKWYIREDTLKAFIKPDVLVKNE